MNAIIKDANGKVIKQITGSEDLIKNNVGAGETMEIVSDDYLFNPIEPAKLTAQRRFIADTRHITVDDGNGNMVDCSNEEMTRMMIALFSMASGDSIDWVVQDKLVTYTKTELSAILANASTTQNNIIKTHKVK